MALNFSHRPIFTGHMSEDNLVDPIRISNGGYLVEGITENNVDAFGKQWHLNREAEDYGRERCDKSGSHESVSKDILDLLPSDPFGMDISSTFTAITGWLEDLEAGYGGYGRNEAGISSGDYQLFAGLNFIWNNAIRFQAFQGKTPLSYQPNAVSWYGGCSSKKGAGNVSFPIDFGPARNMEGTTSGYSTEKVAGDVSCCPIGSGSAWNMECRNSGYSSEKGARDVSCPTDFGSACSMEGMNSGYLSEERGVTDFSCPTTAFGSACNIEGMADGYRMEEKGIADVSCPVGFGTACGMEEITSVYGGCSNEMEDSDGSYHVPFGPSCNMEEMTSVYGECLEGEGVSGIPFPVVQGLARNMEDLSSGYGGCSEGKGVRDLPCSVGYMEGIMRHRNDATYINQIQYQTEEHGEGCLEEAPRLVLSLVIGYLGVRDLLSVESVCKYLRATVKSEPYLWTRINIDQPLNEKIMDELLLQLTDRAQGELQCLSLVDCTRITDDGLKLVLDNNPKLTKLSVPGCSKLTIEGIVNSLKAFKSMGAEGIKQLKIGALYGVEKYFEDLKVLLGIDCNMQKNVRKQHFYHTRHFYLSCDDDDDRALDIEMCPKCERLRLIYDCTAESCQRKEQTLQACRACTLCIPRCFKCGRCIIDGEYEETFCLDWLCSFCKNQEDLAKPCYPGAPLQP